MIPQDDIKARFDEYYWRNIFPLMMEKEKIRKKYVSNLITLIIISAILLPLVMYFSWYLTNKYEKEWIINVAYFVIVINAFILRGPFVLYKAKVKRDIMRCFISFFDGFKYEYGKGLTYYEIVDSYIFPKFDEILADDCFFGYYDDIGIRICEERLVKYSFDQKGKRRKLVTFLGVVLEIDMNKNFQYQTYVIKDRGLLNHFNKSNHFERVALEDVVFEKEFEAYSENQIEARYLLTTAFMERMLKLKELYKGKDIQFSFFNSKVLIAINTKKDMFEPCNLLKTNMQEKQIYTVFEQFQTIFSVVEILKLNQKTGL